MYTSEFRTILACNPDADLHIMLPSGEFVPEHFHITEIGRVHKDFIDCGGVRRETTSCVLQVWVATDVDHRLNSLKLAKIFTFAKFTGLDDLPLEIECQSSDSITIYPVAGVEVTPMGLLLVLGVKKTECLAPDKCGVAGCC